MTNTIIGHPISDTHDRVVITGHTTCDMFHLFIITDGAAILFNQDIHKVKVAILRCQDYRCRAILQQEEIT